MSEFLNVHVSSKATNTLLCVWRAHILPPFLTCCFTLPARWFRRSWINLYPVATRKHAAMLTRHGGGIMWSHGDLGGKKWYVANNCCRYSNMFLLNNKCQVLFISTTCLQPEHFCYFFFFLNKATPHFHMYSWHWFEFFLKVWAFLLEA